MTNKSYRLPKAVYEVLPFFYLMLGTSSLLLDHSIGLDILGAVLIARGLYTLLLRLNYRSPNQALQKSPIRHRDH
ncbi:MAG: hypothetical protein OEY52_13430 [Gammaproteobacteria bacterium]|nr:hypothetical protein [Gammaproteobacteria bacterium]